MELIKKTGTKLIGKDFQSFGIFNCPYCNKKVNKRLWAGKTQKSCGCIKNELISKATKKNGTDIINFKLYHVWFGMKLRCYNITHKAYKNYGFRGIKICKEWLNSFIVFKKWAIDNGYKIGLTIDRINNNGNYNPSNCRWVTYTQNNRNKRNTKLKNKDIGIIKIMRKKGVHYKDVCQKFNISYRHFYKITNN